MMAAAPKRYAGQPLYALLCILVLYTAARAYWWETPFSEAFVPLVQEAVGMARHDMPQGLRPFVDEKSAPVRSGSVPHRTAYQSAFTSVPAPITAAAKTGTETSSSIGTIARSVHSQLRPNITSLEPQRRPATIADGVTELVARPVFGPRIDPGASQPEAASAAAAGADRWSFAGWLLYRPGSARGSFSGSGQQPPAYGASQAGAVLRYRLVPSSLNRPAAYVRVTSALGRARDQEVAAGLSARPVAEILLVIAAETRVNRQAANTAIRPAIFAYTELPRLELPHHFRAEIYGQAGYVGGDFATPFADGQLKIDRPIAAFDLAKIRAGIGGWGGAQDGASRMDAGPTVTAEFDIGGVPVSVSADYRYRVAGNAVPQSGAAITVTTGF